jgi:hypothetical protein
VNSLRTWNASGLLDMVAERVALLNDPLPQEHAMALQHGFQVLQPKDIPNARVRISIVPHCTFAALVSDSRR